MIQEEKWGYINALDEELLKGGVVLSEWTSFLVRDAEIAFCSEANLSSILSCQAAIEAHLRFDHFQPHETKGWGFYQLIENADLDSSLKTELHELREFRNKWVHVKDPHNDEDLLERPEYHETQLEVFAAKAIKIMLKTIYSNPCV